MEPPQPNQRLLSLDVFRGATIVTMILVNNPGTWAHVYGPLRHAEWHGWTITDLVFPFFLFIVGVAIPLSLGPRLDSAQAEDRSRLPLLGKVAKRTLILFGLGLLLAIYPLLHFPLISDRPGVGIRPASWEWLRIMGVLQRIALCYLAAAAAFLFLKERSQRWLAALLLLGYWTAMTVIPVPGYGPGELDDPQGNLGAHLDRLILGQNHLWAGAGRNWDPEGLFSTIPAIATTLFGVFVGQLLRRSRMSERTHQEPEPEPRAQVPGRQKRDEWVEGAGPRIATTARLFVFGFLLTIVGYVWNWFFPINKSIWTSSYAVFTAGLGTSVLALCYWFLDAKPHFQARRLARPFVVYGVNALTVFVLSGLLAKTLILVKVPFRFTTETAAAVERTSLQAWIFNTVFAPLASPINASLLFALTWILGWYLVLSWLYRRNWILKV